MEQQEDMPVSVRIVSDEIEWESLRPDWHELYASSPVTSAPLDFAWLRGWWQVYSPTFTDSVLRIITIWRGTRLVGVLPLYIRTEADGPLSIRQLGLLSTGEAEFEETCAEYLDVLCADGHRDVCTREVWRAIDSMEWDCLEFRDVQDSATLLRNSGERKGIRFEPRGQCPVADLEGGFDSFLGRLSANSRQNARRLLREAERAGAHFEIVEADAAPGAFADLVSLHQQRWRAEGKAGVFAAPRFVQFHQSLIAQWIAEGRVVLARLSMDSRPIAVLYGFVTGKTFDFYQSGIRIDDAGPLRSPGILVHLMLLKELSLRGITTYDFLRGSMSYKDRLTTRSNELTSIRIWRPTLATALYRSLKLARRVLRHGMRVVARHAPRKNHSLPGAYIGAGVLMGPEVQVALYALC